MNTQVALVFVLTFVIHLVARSPMRSGSPEYARGASPFPSPSSISSLYSQEPPTPSRLRYWQSTSSGTYFRKCVILFVLSRLVATIFAQLLFVPSAKLVMVVSVLCESFTLSEGQLPQGASMQALLVFSDGARAI